MPAEGVTQPVKAAFCIVLLSISAFAQQQHTKVLRLAHTENVQNQQEIATVLRSIIEVRDLTIDSAQRTITISAPHPEQLEAAEWLLAELDRPQGSPIPDTAPEHRLRMAGVTEPVVKVLHARNAATVQQLQEVATAVRALVEIRRLFTYSAPRAIIIRGTPEQAKLGEWLLRELDQPGGGDAVSATAGQNVFRMQDVGPEGVVRVVFVRHATTVQQLQELATMVRATVEIRRLFTYNTPRAIALRGTAEQIAVAQWMLEKLDREPSRLEEAAGEYRLSGSGDGGKGDDVLRLFVVKQAANPAQLQETAVAVRSHTNVRRLFTYNALRAMAVRGTTAQLEQARVLLDAKQ